MRRVPRWLAAALDACRQGERLPLLPMVTAGFLRLVTHSRVFVELTPWPAAQEFLAALLAQDGVEWLHLGEEWPLLEALCRQHQLTGNAVSDGWIAAAVLARQERLVTLDRELVSLLPPGQLTLLRS
ncbi:MAG: hypothetical protein RLZZ468_514 [Cyanobacteriota bacterium]